MLSAASVSALAISGIFASTGMIIWALIGFVGMLSGLITVSSARRRNRPALDSEQTVPDAEENSVSPDALIKAA